MLKWIPATQTLWAGKHSYVCWNTKSHYWQQCCILASGFIASPDRRQRSVARFWLRTDPQMLGIPVKNLGGFGCGRQTTTFRPDWRPKSRFYGHSVIWLTSLSRIISNFSLLLHILYDYYRSYFIWEYKEASPDALYSHRISIYSKHPSPLRPNSVFTHGWTGVWRRPSRLLCCK